MTTLLALALLAPWLGGLALTAGLIAGGVRRRRGPMPGEPRHRAIWRRPRPGRRGAPPAQGLSR